MEVKESEGSRLEPSDALSSVIEKFWKQMAKFRTNSQNSDRRYLVPKYLIKNFTDSSFSKFYGKCTKK
jgi:hypothetical protein